MGKIEQKLFITLHKMSCAAYSIWWCVNKCRESNFDRVWGETCVVVKMENIVAPINKNRFEIERMIENQVGILPLAFEKMDKSLAATCNNFPRKECKFGMLCPFRHVRMDKNVVCKHWLRGLCKKGDDCEFLHVYDITKMPECYFYSMLNLCTNKECIFLHINPNDKVKDCPWYNRGFCRRGPDCRLKHIRRVICTSYLNGFCPRGNNCEAFHGKFYVDMESFKSLLN